MNLTLCPVWPHWMPSIFAEAVISRINEGNVFEVAETTFYSNSTFNSAVDSLSERFSEIKEEGSIAVPIGYYGGGAVAAKATNLWPTKVAALVMIGTPTKPSRTLITAEASGRSEVLSIVPDRSLLDKEYVSDGESEIMENHGVVSMLFSERMALEIGGWLNYKIKPLLDQKSYQSPLAR